MGNNYDFSIQTNKNQAIKIKSYVDGIATISLGDNLTLGKSAREVELLFESDFEEQLNNLFPEYEFHGILCKIHGIRLYITQNNSKGTKIRKYFREKKGRCKHPRL